MDLGVPDKNFRMRAPAATVSTVLGTIGTVLWCIQLVPQIYTNYRRKSTEGLPRLMLLLWAFAGVLFGIYFLVQKPNVPLMVQPEIFTALSLITWAQCLFYNHKVPFWKTIAWVVSISVFCGALQVVAVILLQKSALYLNNPSPTCWPLLLIGIVAAFLIATGLIPPYIDLARRQGQVVGINFMFLAIDSVGAIFSFASLLVPQSENKTIDYLGIVLYALMPIMEAGIVLSHVGWWLRIGRRRRRESEKNETHNVNNDFHEVRPVE
ncbi:PQ loop repeat-domain-containing protein [Lipomyces starkeyi]|uniref:Uncharacterized protein n=1 Tax=Lipomyces starkeyi NRRL Y-11557 TaxID=675824 RepID=A0A1E3Q1L4_LIPST|nr:hypothetical protein LIPSTDRAFT_4726 [Lipomyces starkeyi NRRL Y-11557]